MTNRMNRCHRLSLLTAALSAALPLHASNVETDATDRSTTELATVRVQAKTTTKDTASSSFGSGD